MKEIALGNTGSPISCLGLGTMYFGSKTDENTAFSLLDCYFEHGGSFLDTANKYASWVPGFQGGESELTIGKWLASKKNRHNLFIASKVGFPYGEIPHSLKNETIISECEKSLKRMGTDNIDLYFAHAYDENTPPEETMEAFYLLKKSGKIRFAGASNFTALQLEKANSIASKMEWDAFCCLQQRYSYFEPVQGADFGNQMVLTPELMELCNKLKIGIMAYSPLLGGFYSSKGKELPFQYKSKTNELKFSRLQELSAKMNIKENALVLAWMIHHSPPVIPVSAAGSVTQLKENLESLNIRLSTDQVDYLNLKTRVPD